jgi:predicted nuclease of predicted toxin-antitoxin system
LSKIRFLLDEGVPHSVGRVLQEAGYEVIFFEKILVKGSPDVLVQETSMLNEAVLVALDGDMSQAAKGWGVGSNRFKRLNLLKLSCRESQAAERVKETLPLIELEWNLESKTSERRLFVEIGKMYVKTHRWI